MEFLTLFSPESSDILKSIRLSGIIPGIISVVVILFLMRFMQRSFDALGERSPQQRLLFKQVSVLLRFFLGGLGIVLFIAFVFDLSGTSLSFFLGLFLVGLSFSSRDLIASFMSGVILLFDRPFQVGDRVLFRGVYGEVQEIGLRSVRIVDLDDNLLSIPNSLFLNEMV